MMNKLALTALAALAATLVSSAVATPIDSEATDFVGPPGLKEFQLTTIPNGDNDTYSGWWLVPFHTGAGLNAAVLKPTRDLDPTWCACESRNSAFTTPPLTAFDVLCRL